MAVYVHLFRVMTLPANAARFASAVIAAGAIVLATEACVLPAPGWTLAVYLSLAFVSSAIKIRLDRVPGYFTLNFLFVLAGVVYFSLPETVIACCAAGLGMSLLNTKTKSAPIQIAFNVANLVLSGTVAYVAAHRLLGDGLANYRPAWFAMVTTVYFVVNTSLVAGILSLVSEESFRDINARYYVTSFPYYLVGATAVGLLPLAGSAVSPESFLVLPPLLYLAIFFNGIETGKASRSFAAVARSRPVHGGSRFAIIVTALGAMLLVLAAIHWESRDQARFAVFSAVGIAASFPRVSLPGIRGTISAGLVLVLAAVVDLSLSEAILMAALVSLPAAFAKTRNRTIHPLLSMSISVIATATATVICRWPLAQWFHNSMPAILVSAALLVCGISSLLTGGAMRFAEGRPAAAVIERFFFWGLPYYFAGAAAAGLIVVTWRSAGWAPSLLVIPILALLAVTYRLHVRNAAASLASA